jgi:cytochrome c biogenesis protein
MSITTAGLEVAARSRWMRDAIELLSSMRFAISLLTVICIASVIGTVVLQNEPVNNYVNQFGPFWAEVFGAVQLYNVYSAPWFLLILAFLVVSTSLCIIRSTPKILADLRNYKEGVREQSLAAFRHKGQGRTDETPDAALARVGAELAAAGWSAKVQQRPNGVMIAARKGKPHKIGYIAAHSAIVLICVGGLSDGDMMVRLQMLLQGKSVFTGGGLVSDVPAEYRLSARSPTYRANLLIPEGGRGSTAVIPMGNGVVLQELPFDVELKQFIVEYYPTGMPRLFASEIIVHDHATGDAIPHRVEVNHPAFHRGIAIYQSSFDDGGSRVKLRGEPMRAGMQPFEVEGIIGGASELVATGPAGEETITLEFAELRLINVENFGPQALGMPTDVRAVNLRNSIESRLGSGTRVVNQRELRNVGPSITYRLRDAAGQAREYHNYMLPVDVEGEPVFLLGMRETVADTFRYLRIPADDEGRMDGWLRLRRALDNPAMREAAARRYVALATPPDRPEMEEQLFMTTQRTLGLFAGAEGPQAVTAVSAFGTDTGANNGGATGRGDDLPHGGLQALGLFLENTVPENDRMRISEVMLRILNGSLFELYNMTREAAGKPRMVIGDEAEHFMTQAVTSLSDSFHYPAPLMFQLADFTQVQASVFQVARAPGKTLVYIGSVALIIGIFVMLYVRDRRLWVWLTPDAADASASGGTRISTALSTTRRTLEADNEFEQLRQALLREPETRPQPQSV